MGALTLQVKVIRTCSGKDVVLAWVMLIFLLGSCLVDVVVLLFAMQAQKALRVKEESSTNDGEPFQMAGVQFEKEGEEESSTNDSEPAPQNEEVSHGNKTWEVLQKWLNTYKEGKSVIESYEVGKWKPVPKNLEEPAPSEPDTESGQLQVERDPEVTSFLKRHVLYAKQFMEGYGLLFDTTTGGTVSYAIWAFLTPVVQGLVFGIVPEEEAVVAVYFALLLLLFKLTFLLLHHPNKNRVVLWIEVCSDTLLILLLSLILGEVIDAGPSMTVCEECLDDGKGSDTAIWVLGLLVLLILAVPGILDAFFKLIGVIFQLIMLMRKSDNSGTDNSATGNSGRNTPHDAAQDEGSNGCQLAPSSTVTGNSANEGEEKGEATGAAAGPAEGTRAGRFGDNDSQSDSGSDSGSDSDSDQATQARLKSASLNTNFGEEIERIGSERQANEANEASLASQGGGLGTPAPVSSVPGGDQSEEAETKITMFEAYCFILLANIKVACLSFSVPFKPAEQWVTEGINLACVLRL
ncbi:unnamed protein product [Chrysoparadoxa australica]